MQTKIYGKKMTQNQNQDTMHLLNSATKSIVNFPFSFLSNYDDIKLRWPLAVIFIPFKIEWNNVRTFLTTIVNFSVKIVLER